MPQNTIPLGPDGGDPSNAGLPGEGIVDPHIHLRPFDQMVAGIASRPKWPVYGVTAVTVGLAWAWVTFLAAGASAPFGGEALGPGMGLADRLFNALQVDPAQSPILAKLIELCTPANDGVVSLPGFFISVGMWFAMSLAMMLPSAAPMMRTYADIADVAAQKGEKVVSVSVLAAGYLAVWLVFSVAGAAVQRGLMALNLIDNTVLPISGVLAAVILAGAGLYQFSSLREACLEKCRNPFSIIFGQWSTRPARIFRLGVQQGVFCVGCCWALMLVMLVVGTMNLAWMAFLTLFAIIEKSGTGKVTSRVSGGILLGWGGILLALSVWSA
ncbi:MAG: DUF2182 domain-containing protein [Pseudomonadota bacterium]